ncbi:hypothetical protein [Mumia zhuanghuii]|uniref:Uncharacterized protein n=1 Tax=Mumia zhuanghuii TaxID=2585211 RepID=A0A5C4MDC7_9ACTN|nr:hypothetical protein [Mumia zhuanghuii]TNC31317.1 hypothetical protein FHE65_32120 [Mumia zhuanghuii]
MERPLLPYRLQQAKMLDERRGLQQRRSRSEMRCKLREPCVSRCFLQLAQRLLHHRRRPGQEVRKRRRPWCELEPPELRYEESVWALEDLRRVVVRECD